MPDPAPNPPRYRWLKRLVLLAMIATAGLSLLRLYWGHREQSQLEQVVEAARAKGYPVYFEDLQPAQLPSSDNRATYIAAAIGAIPAINAQGQTLMDTDWYTEGGTDYFEEHQLPDPVTDNAFYLALYQPVLDNIRQAAALTSSDWTFGQPIPRPAFSMLLPQLGDCRHLARSIRDAIDRAMDVGDYPAAIAMLADLMTIAQALRDDPYVLIDHLVVISIRAQAADAVQAVLPQLPDDPALAGPLAELNALWLDEDWVATGLSKALQSELWLIYDYLDGIIAGRYSISAVYGYTPDALRPLEFAPTRRMFRPYYQNDLAFIVAYFTRLCAAAEGCTNRAEFERRLGPEFDLMQEEIDDASDIWPIDHPLAVEAVWVGPVHRTTYRHLAGSRMCATAIAVKRFAIDHGRRPDILEELVPDYLPAVPDDPFVIGRPITYRPDGVRPVLDEPHRHFSPTAQTQLEIDRRAATAYPLLYCVADDGRDDGGAFPINEENGVIRGWFQGSDGTATDWCYFLSELPKPIPDPQATPFNQRGSYGPGLGGPSLPGANNPQPAHDGDDSPGDEEQVDEPGDGGEDGEDHHPPAQPEQRDE